MTDKINPKDLPNLEDKEFLDKYKIHIENVQFSNNIALAKDISDILLALFGETPNFNKKNPELFKEYQSILIRARWIALPLLKNPDVLEMFEKYFMEGLAMVEYINLWEKLRFKLMNILVIENRDKLKQAIRKSLERNGQLIISNSIQKDEEKRESTIGNWILEFTTELGDNMFDKVKENQYFVNGKNVKGIPEEEKENLRILLDIYRRCGRSSQTVEGLEESIPVDSENRIGTIYEGQFREIKQSEWKGLVGEMKRLRNKDYSSEVTTTEMSDEEVKNQKNKLIEEFLGSEKERTEIHKEESNIEQIANDGLRPVIEIFVEAVNQKNKYKAIAALKVTVEKGNLLAELKNNKRVSSITKKVLQKKYKPEIMADFQRNGFIAPYLSLFLQYAFKEKMNLNDEESARYGVQLENMLLEKGQTEVQGMVYGDLVSGKYLWQEVRDEGIKLSIPESGENL